MLCNNAISANQGPLHSFNSVKCVRDFLVVVSAPLMSFTGGGLPQEMI